LTSRKATDIPIEKQLKKALGIARPPVYITVNSKNATQDSKEKSAMNAFEYAMQMELDGKKYYEEQAAAMSKSVLKTIYEELAGDEQRHYNIFKSMSEGKTGDFVAAFKTNILSTTKNVFQQLKDSNEFVGEFPADVKEAWVKARAIEDKSEKFYREQAQKAEKDDEKEIWMKIANEEHKHWVALDNVIQYINRPNQWLENAEWTQIEE
jgi:rubrerythrin